MDAVHTEDLPATSVRPTHSRSNLDDADVTSDTAGQGGSTGEPPSDARDAEEIQDREDGDGAPEGEEDGYPSALDDADDWEELYVCPLNVRFTQERIHPFFYRRGPIVNVVPKIRPVQRTIGEHDDVIELVPPFNPIHCLRKGSELWSLDNRRLYALQLACMEQWPRQCRVRLLCRDKLPRHKFKTHYRKFNTTSEGRAIDVCARYQQFDTWNWYEHAVDVEWYAFSSRLSSIFTAFQVMPVVGALLFRTGFTGFASRTPLILGFALTFATDFLRQKVPVLERKICELQVKAVVDGDVKYVCSCCHRLLQGRNEENFVPRSAAQLAAMMALALLLLLPYVLGLAYKKLRSSLLSCWLGVACVLIVQLGSALGAASASADSECNGRLTPKHRGDPSSWQ